MTFDKDEQPKILDYETSLYLQRWSEYLVKESPTQNPFSEDKIDCCPHPVKIPFKHGDKTFGTPSKEWPRFEYVPCGRCLYCLNKRAHNWFVRYQYEKNDLSVFRSYFVTLTYSDDALRDYHCLCLDHAQKFLKRVRRRGFRLSFSLLGEYGPHTCRPHYHILVFLRQSFNASEYRSFFRNLFQEDGRVDPTAFDASFRNTIAECWPYGFVDIRSPTDSHLYYIAKYTTKLFLPYAAFKTHSSRPAIAESHALEDAKMYGLTGDPRHVDQNGRMYATPRYFRRKLEETYHEGYQTNRYIGTDVDYALSPLQRKQEIVQLSKAFNSFLKRKI